jgi:hypothetical protein
LSGGKETKGQKDLKDEKDLGEVMGVSDGTVGSGCGFARRGEAPAVFSCDGSLGRRTGMEGSWVTRLLFGVAPSDHEMLFVIINMFYFILTKMSTGIFVVFVDSTGKRKATE